MNATTRLLLASLLLAPLAATLARAAAIAAMPDMGLLILAAPPSLWWWLSALLLLVLLLAYLPLGILASPRHAAITPTALSLCIATGWPLQVATLALLSDSRPRVGDCGLYLLMLATSCAGGWLGWHVGRQLRKLA